TPAGANGDEQVVGLTIAGDSGDAEDQAAEELLNSDFEPNPSPAADAAGAAVKKSPTAKKAKAAPKVSIDDPVATKLPSKSPDETAPNSTKSKPDESLWKARKHETASREANPDTRTPHAPSAAKTRQEFAAETMEQAIAAFTPQPAPSKPKFDLSARPFH